MTFSAVLRATRFKPTIAFQKLWIHLFCELWWLAWWLSIKLPLRIMLLPYRGIMDKYLHWKFGYRRLSLDPKLWLMARTVAPYMRLKRPPCSAWKKMRHLRTSNILLLMFERNLRSILRSYYSTHHKWLLRRTPACWLLYIRSTYLSFFNCLRSKTKLHCRCCGLCWSAISSMYFLCSSVLRWTHKVC